MARNRRPSPQDAMLDLIGAYWLSQLVLVAARLGLANLLAKGPRTAEALAKECGADAGHLRRVLRALASQGVFAEDARGRFKLTALAQTLRSDRPGSLRDYALMLCDDYNWQAWGALTQGVQHGGVPFEKVFGQPFFEYLRQHPEKEAAFAASMASTSSVQNEAVARAYPFDRLARLVDVGGAHGHLLATILRRHKKLRGVLYDQTQVVAGAPASGFVTAPGLAERCEIVGGDFFEAVPAGADGYLMKYILHDWDDARCVRLLGLCRDAMAADGRVLVAEHVIPRGNKPYRGKLLDVMMLVVVTGRERTREEFRDLFARAGLRLRRVYATACPLFVLEGVRT